MATRSESRKHSKIYEKRTNSKGDLYYQEYQLGKLLGKGGFAHVYECKKKNEEMKAMKVISLIQKDKKPDLVEKIENQINLLKEGSNGTSGVVKYYHSFKDKEAHYIVMELCKEGSLSDILKKRKTLTQPQVRHIVVQMVRFLQVLRHKNIIHRDIKLANIFVDKDFNLKLGDFGLATINDAAFREKRAMCGTPNYIAPEVIEKKAYGFEVDLWATGVIIFTLLLGVPPFETKSCKDTYQRIRKGSYRFEGINKNIRISSDAKMFIADLLQLDPKKRLKLQNVCDHPFIKFYLIPTELERSFPQAGPSHHFLKKYEKRKNTRHELNNHQINMPKNNEKEVSLEKRERCLSKPLYKNVLKNSAGLQNVKPITSKRSQPFNRQKKQQIEQIKKQISNKDDIPFELKRKNNQEWKYSHPKKKFRSNIEVKEQFQQMNSIMPKKMYSDKKTQAEMNLINAKLLGLEISLKDNILQNYYCQSTKTIQKASLVSLEQMQDRKFIKFVKRKEEKDKQLKLNRQLTKVVWCSIIYRQNLVYRLSNGQLGIMFKDGTQIVATNFGKILFFDNKQQSVDQNGDFNESVYEQKMQILQFFKSELQTTSQIRQKTIDTINTNDQITLLKGYLIDVQIKIFSFTNKNCQFQHSEGWNIMILNTQNCAIFEQNKSKTIIQLPLMESQKNSRAGNCYKKALSYLLFQD